MGFQLSPGVEIKEVDLSTTVAPVASGLGATVGFFGWGPVMDPTTITSENQLVSTFGRPDDGTASSFFSTANFLRYADNIKVVRIVDLDGNNSANASDSGGNVLIKNADDFDSQYATLSGAGNSEPFFAKYPGDMGNYITVSHSDSVGWSTYPDANIFDVEPDSSNNEYAVVVKYYNELVHSATTYNNTASYLAGTVVWHSDVAWKCIQYLDQSLGDIEPGVGTNTNLYWEAVDYTVVESYIVSSDSTGTGTSGENIFADEVINKGSQWIWCISDKFVSGNGTVLFSGGLAGTPNDDEWSEGWDLFVNPEETEINLCVTGGASSLAEASAKLVAEKVVNQVAAARGDCMAFISPPEELVVPYIGQSSIISSNVIDYRKSLNVGTKAGTYAVIDGNFKYQYDKYNDKYRWISINADVAGLCVYTDSVRDPWWSPGGLNRGNIKSVVKLAWNPAKAYRDDLYKNAVNPIVSFPGQGTVLWGDKTMTNKPSAFDRINVRRLFIFLEQAVSRVSKYFLFEFNDAFTRKQFVNMVDPFLRDVKGRRGMYDYLVVCDDSNNTGEVIDRNEFKADFYIKPTKSINFITLTFVATKTGVAFSEVIG